MFQAFCILEDNNKDTYKIGSYKIVPKKWMIAYLLDWAHKSIKSHLKTRKNLFNFKRKSIVEQVIMNTENSRKAFLQEIDFEVGDLVLLTSWITELPNIRIRLFKKEKPMKDTKGERQEINSIQAEIIKKGLYYCIVDAKKSRYQTNYSP